MEKDFNIGKKEEEFLQLFKKGEEVTSEVLDGKHSVVLHQAANRLHVQKGIIGALLKGDSP